MLNEQKKFCALVYYDTLPLYFAGYQYEAETFIISFGVNMNYQVKIFSSQVKIFSYVRRILVKRKNNAQCNSRKGKNRHNSKWMGQFSFGVYLPLSSNNSVIQRKKDRH